MDDFQVFVLLKNTYGGTVPQASKHYRGNQVCGTGENVG